MKRLLRAIRVSFFSALIICISATNVSAFDYFGHRLIGGITTNAYYTIPTNANYTYNGITVDYSTPISSANSDWYVNVSKYGFWNTTDYSKSKIDFYVSSAYGNSGWNGVTEYFSNSGTQLCPTSAFPASDYGWCKIKLNAYNIQTLSALDKQRTCAHEIGHAIGLKHVNNPVTLMYPDWIRSTTKFVTQDEINGANYLY